MDKSADAAFERVYQEVDAICGLFRKNLNKYAGKTFGDVPLVPDYFFSPLGYVPIGHADVMAITVFDDLDPIHSLTARCSTTVEEVAVGFAPLMESLGVSTWPEPFRQCAVDVERFVEGGANLPPLLLFSRIKLGAIGLLGKGIAFQTAVFRAVLADCLEGLKTLHGLEEEKLAKFDADSHSVTSCRLTLLDLQGQEEIGLLVAADNFSIATALLSRIQGMTLRDIQQFGAPLDDLFLDDSWVKGAQDLLENMGETLGDDFDKSVMNSHALRWTRTTLAVRKDAFGDPLKSRVRGYIDLVSSANIAVGHQEKLDQAIELLQQENDQVPKFKPGTEFWQQLMGHADLLIHQAHPGIDADRFIPTMKAIEQVRALIEKMSGNDETDGMMPRHLVGLSSWPTIPIPAHSTFRRDLVDHYPVLQKILPVVRWRMVDFGNDEGVTCIRHDGERDFVKTMRRMKEGHIAEPGLCPYTLCTEPKKYLIPSSLVRTVQYLFQNYTTLLANPYVFDTVLDLHDCFATFYDILTKHLPEVYGSKNGGRESGRYVMRQLPSEVVSQLSRYVSALHRAMEQRLYHAFPEEAHRDMDVDFRGGLNQLISGADALVRAGMGFVKRLALPRGTFPEEDKNKPRFNLYGVVNRIDFEPEIVATSLWLGTERRARLAIIRSDVPHLCVVASYLDFIHEVGHIVFAEHRHPRSKVTDTEQSAEIPLLPLVPIKSATEVLLSEIYTHALTTLLVCREEPAVFAKHSMASYALATHPGADLRSRYQIFLRFSFQVFVAQRCVSMAGIEAAAQPSSWVFFKEHPRTKELIEKLCTQNDALREEFRDFVRDVGRVCHEQPEYLEEDPDAIFMDAAFDFHWDSIRYSLPILIVNVVDVYIRFVFRMGGLNEELDDEAKGVQFYQKLTLLESKLGEALSSEENCGIPVVHLAETVATEVGYADPKEVESFHLICIALGVALRLRMESLDFDKTIHVPVDPLTGEIDFESAPAKGTYSDYMIRPRDSFLFCCRPEKRRQRLQRQIALLKTLWNTASEIKARRFGALIKSSISQPANMDAGISAPLS